jgi:DNA polymerase zeta
LFIQFAHATRAQAFEQSHLLVKALNQLYPSPIKIKFEKIYMQSVLASKKRYVGLAYETYDQKHGKFDAKGIETVRRDTCPIVSRILQHSLKILFQTRNVTRVRRYVQDECTKMINNHVNLLECVFAKEYRGKNKYHAAAPVPALRIAMERAQTNPLAEPNAGERVPYLIGLNNDMSNANLIDCVWTLDRVLTMKSQFQLNTSYYIRKQILPAVDRCLALIGVNVFKWIDDIPLTSHIDTYQCRRRCVRCAQISSTPLCTSCCNENNLIETIIVCETKANKVERQHALLQRQCLACSDRIDGWFQCSTNDCPVRYRLHKINKLMAIAQETRLFVQNRC